MDRSLVSKTCQNPACGKSYEVARRKAESSRFCSVACKDAGAVTRPATPCPVCGAPVKGKGTYCSPEHYQEARAGKPRRRRSDAGQARSDWVFRQCEGPDCHNFVARRASEVRTVICCSRGCWLRRRENAPRSGRPNYPVGTRRLTGDGYIRIKVATGTRGWRMEHVVAVEDWLGRPLLPGEEVHHKNGVRDDNRLTNLELWVTSQPSGQRVPDLVEWAVEILARYAPDRLAGPVV